MRNCDKIRCFVGKKFSAMKFSENEALVTEVTVHRKHRDERNESMTARLPRLIPALYCTVC